MEEITIKTAAKILNEKKPMIKEYIKEGILHNIGDGRSIRISLDEVLDFAIKSGKQSELFTNINGNIVLDFDESLKLIETMHSPNAKTRPLRYLNTKSKYAVSNKSRVFNLKTNQELAQYPAAHGYLQTNICNINETVHGLVAYAWCPNRLTKTQVHHIDGDILNNNAVNLIWVTAVQHKDLHVLLKKAKASGDYTEYNNAIEKIQEENKYTEEVRCLLFPKDNCVIMTWMPKDKYLAYKAGKITLDEIDGVRFEDMRIVSYDQIFAEGGKNE